ncbi:MAG TPA: hypothetical protein ENN29_02435 [Candidatus Hydrogenedentes bacterium]|nr:hypothetical protein [Candidatus Hydrogenedentota bacterium]
MNHFCFVLFVILRLSHGAIAADADWDALAAYAYGQDRAPLHEISGIINRAHDDPAVRAEMEQRFIMLLNREDATVDAKAFACEMLGRIGSYPAIFPVAKLLAEPILAAHALTALERIPQAEANRALREALSVADAPLRGGIITALGNRGAASSVETLAALLNTSDHAAAAAALGNIASDEAIKALMLARAGTGADPALESAVLQCAYGPVGDNNPEYAAILFDFLYREGANAPLQTAGFMGLIRQEADGLPALFREALRADAPHFIEATLIALGSSGSGAATAAALADVLHELEPEAQRMILEAVSARKDHTAMETVPPNMRDAADAVRKENNAAPMDDAVANAAIRPEDPLLPDGHRIVAYLNCGAGKHVTGGVGPAIALLSGTPCQFPGIEGAVGTAACDPAQVVCEISGLNPDADYVLAFTWWDADNGNRMQSVRLSVEGDQWKTVLPPARAAAYDNDASTWARVLLPLCGGYSNIGNLRAAFVNESGPSAVVNEIYVLQRIAPAKPKRVLIVTGDDYGGHHWRSTASALAALLREDERLEVSINECPAIYGSPLLVHYDATVLHFKNYAERTPLDRAVGKGLKNHVANGGGLVLTHFACGAFQEWEAFVKIAGRVWNPDMRPHDPHGAFTVHITDAEHLITQGMDAFEITDELYTCLDGDTPITVLCDAVSAVDKKTYPMGFVVENTGGRVFHSTLGHDAASYDTPGARALYRRAAAWAAGLEPIPLK